MSVWAGDWVSRVREAVARDGSTTRNVWEWAKRHRDQSSQDLVDRLGGGIAGEQILRLVAQDAGDTRKVEFALDVLVRFLMESLARHNDRDFGLAEGLAGGRAS